MIICGSSQKSVDEAKTEFEATDSVDIVKCDVTIDTDRHHLLSYIKDYHSRIDVLFVNHGIIGKVGNQLEIS